MGQLSYQEIIFTSSEKDIFTGNAGFGVRTCTRGMDSTDVYKIVDACVTGYDVYNERVLDMDRILANPDVVYDYPPAYLFRAVELNDGSIRYVFGRTVYLGVDYGFFKGINAYDRAGTNYLTHLLVFSEMPTTAIIRDLLVDSKYLPVNYSCTPDNIELKKLLTGNPEFLEEKSFEPDENPVLENDSVDHAPLIKGVVQMLRNRQLPSGTDVPEKMYVKCPWKDVESCLKALDIFPPDLLGCLRYITCFMQGYGIPDGYDLAFVNEFNEAELYEDNYITADLFSGTHKNVSDNLILSNIGNLVRQHDAVSAAKLIQFYLDLKDVSDADYEFYYHVFLGAVSDLDITLSDLTETTLKKLSGVQLDQTQDARFWGKVNKALNDGLTSTQGRDFLLAVEKVRQIQAYCPGKVRIGEDIVSYVTGILFSGRGNLGKIADERNIRTLLQLVNKSLIPSEESFLKSLEESSVEKVWEACLLFYYDGQFGDSDTVMSSILNSKLSETETACLLQKLFPLSEYADALFVYFKNNPMAGKKAGGTITALVRFYGEERFSDFVWLGQLEPEICKAAAPVISSYFQERIDEDVRKGFFSLFDFLEKVGCDQISPLQLWGVFKAGAQKYLLASLDDIKAFLGKMEEMAVPYHGHMDRVMEVLGSLADRRIPDHVSASSLAAAMRLYPDDELYLKNYLTAWLRSGAGKEDIKAFVTGNVDGIDDTLIEAFVRTIWSCPDIQDGKEKESLVLSVIDHCGWDRNKVEEFSKLCGNEDLGDFLQKSNGVFGKLVRRLFK